MSSDYQAEVRRLLYGGEVGDEAALGAVEQAVRIADTHNDTALAMEAREALSEAAYWAGFPDKALVAFGWCLAQLDRDPERFGGRTFDLLWRYKSLMGEIAWFPQIPRGRIDETFRDMARRYEAAGYGLRPVEGYRCLAACYMGDWEEAAARERRWMSLPRDRMADCLACEADEHVEYLVWTGQYERALQEAEPLLAGRRRCMEVPQVTYNKVLLPLVRLGDWERAMECHRRAVRGDSEGHKYIAARGRHVAFLALAGRFTPALRLVERGLGPATETRKLHERFYFFLGARLLFRRLADLGRDRVKVRLPRDFPGFREDGAYPPADLAQWFLGAAEELAGQFNARNGNAVYSERLADGERLMELARSTGGPPGEP